ncbi:hypothetical protein [Paraburkholderia sp. J12]|uniref:hypothetical protein n=1 Tax=Paraburkholderia sp. J12 TaxID=2805432 RepID=UPI002ABE565B|nr:hypothetical protein [Paraburkholderia sp. J12]
MTYTVGNTSVNLSLLMFSTVPGIGQSAGGECESAPAALIAQFMVKQAAIGCVDIPAQS